LPGFAAGWQGLVAPLGTPAPAIQKIRESLSKTLRMPDLANEFA
jgi:tripartite-type tricarboxylate transporter receptor subunit TctC